MLFVGSLYRLCLFIIKYEITNPLSEHHSLMHYECLGSLRCWCALFFSSKGGGLWLPRHTNPLDGLPSLPNTCPLSPDTCYLAFSGLRRTAPHETLINNPQVLLPVVHFEPINMRTACGTHGSHNIRLYCLSERWSLFKLHTAARLGPNELFLKFAPLCSGLARQVRLRSTAAASGPTNWTCPGVGWLIHAQQKTFKANCTKCPFWRQIQFT